MTLEAKLTEIKSRLTPEHFSGEAAVSQGIVLPILRELNWDTDNPKVVFPEYTAGRGKVAGRDRVDFALCEQTGTPKVFIEVKGLLGGETEDAVDQALIYAFKAGVRIVVLTDGGTWSVYLPAEEGSYEERRVFKLDLSEHSPQKSSEFLQRYLEKSRVVSGEVLEVALRDLGDRRRLEKARRAIPGAWRDIFETSEPDESLNLLVDVLADRVESRVGVRPDDDDVVNFLRSLQRQEKQVFAPPLSGGGERKQPVQRRVRQVSAPPPSRASGGGHSGEIVILGKLFPCKNPTDAMVTVFKELGRRESGFWQRFYNDPRNHGRTRRIIAQEARGLYDSDNPRYEKAYKQLGGGWVIATYNNKKTIEKNIRIATEVAGLEFGRDIIVNFDDSLQRQEGQVSAPPSSGTGGSSRSGELVILGESHFCRNQNNATEIVFKKLQEKDQNFLQRFYEHSENQKNKYKGRRGEYRYLGRSYRQLFGDNVKGSRSFVNIGNRWVVSADYNWEKKKEIIQLAAEVAGLEFGKDIILNFDA